MTPAPGQLFILLVLLVLFALAALGVFYLIVTLVRINRHVTRDRPRHKW